MSVGELAKNIGEAVKLERRVKRMRPRFVVRGGKVRDRLTGELYVKPPKAAKSEKPAAPAKPVKGKKKK